MTQCKSCPRKISKNFPKCPKTIQPFLRTFAGQRWKTEIDALEIPVPDGEHDVTYTGILYLLKLILDTS
jgi:hypothetical protein